MKYLFNKTNTILSVLVLAGLAGWYFLANNETGQADLEEYVVRKETLMQNITITGKVKPRRSSEITAPYNGYVQKIFVRVGQQVKKGSPLVTITQTPVPTSEAFPIRSPFNGTVVQVLQKPGEYVESRRENPIVRVDDTSRFYITANVPEIDIPKIGMDQEVVIKLTALPERTYAGRVKQIFLAEKGSNNWRDGGRVEYPIEIQITKPDDYIRSGMSALIDVVAAKRENVLVVPHEFLIKRDGEYFVRLKSGLEKKIEVGIQNADYFEVTSGVTEGEELKQIDYLSVFDENA